MYVMHIDIRLARLALNSPLLSVLKVGWNEPFRIDLESGPSTGSPPLTIGIYVSLS
jgi:hypothetical protein